MKQDFDSDYLNNVFNNIAFKKVLNHCLHRSITFGRGVSVKAEPVAAESISAPVIQGKEDTHAKQ